MPPAGPYSLLERMSPEEIGKIVTWARQVLPPASMQAKIIELLKHLFVLVRGEASP
jgi:hypothetical protein